MDVIVRSSNNPVNDMTALISGLINDLDKAMMTKYKSKSVWLVIAVGCQSGYSCQ